MPYSWPATAIIEYTWTSLEKISTQKNLIYGDGMCGGILINRRTILTTASCFRNVITFYDWGLGISLTTSIHLNSFHPTLESIYNIYVGTDQYVYYYTDLPHVEIADFRKVIIVSGLGFVVFSLKITFFYKASTI